MYGSKGDVDGAGTSDAAPPTAVVRLALVAPGFPPQLGGVETVVGELAEGMFASGNQVRVFTQRPRHEAWTDGRPYAVHRFPDVTRTRRFPVAPGLWRALRSARADLDVIHAHSFHAAPALMAASIPDVPLVFTPHFHAVGHTTAARLVHLAYDPAAKLLFSRASVVTCVSHAEAALLIRHYPKAGPKIVVIPNGVDVEAIEAARPQPADLPVVLVAGRLESYKRVGLVVEALQWVPGARLVICGKGPAEAALRSQAEELGLSARVSFEGYVEDDQLRRWQRTATVTVTMSTQEAFGLVAIEAAVAGSRVVASDIPAHRELVNLVGDDSLRLVGGTAREVAAAVRQALTQPAVLPVRMGVLGWADVVRRFEAVYAQARGQTVLS